MLTYKNIQDKVLQFLDQAGDTQTGLALVKFAVQTAHNKRLAGARWNFMLWPDIVSLTMTTARYYTLHPEFLMLGPIWNANRQRTMAETPSRARYKIGVQQDSLHFEFVQNAPVKQQPVTGRLTVVGVAKIRYLNSAGDVVTETVTSALTAGTVVTVLNVTKMDANPLTITDTGGNTILSLGATEYGKTYPQIRLMGDPYAGEVVHYRFYRKPVDLSDDNDIPDIPYPYSEILVYDALLEISAYNDATPQQYWLVQQAKWETILDQAYQEGEAEGSEARTVREVDDFQG